MQSDVRIPAGEGAAGSWAHVLFAFEVAAHIDLDRAQSLVAGAARERFRGPARSPAYFEFRPSPLRVDVSSPGVHVGASWATRELVEVTLFEFGAIAVSFAIPIQGRLSDLYDLGDALYENADLLAAARKQAEAVLAQVGPALDRARLAALVEDYVVYQVAGAPGADLSPVLADAAFRREAAKLLRVEPGEPSAQEIDDAMSCAVSLTPADVTIVDWNAAIVIGPDSADAIAVLEFANVELLELRFMDDRLDAMLDQAYEAQQTRPRGWRRLVGLDKGRGEMRRLASMQLDSAMLFEGINNALKLLGDQYLARLYRVTAARLHLPDWDTSILRKLSTLENLYNKLGDEQATIRMELLEILIILLFVVSILMPFVFASGK